MDIKRILSKGVFLRKQVSSWVEDGPLSPVFSQFSQITSSSQTVNGMKREGKRQLVSIVGMDLVRIYARRSLWVLFMDTGGSGIAPWQGLIVLDADYRGKGQIKTPSRLGIVAHELTHLLQREFNQPHYWPGGGLHPARGRRWIGDSTNYMELISYLVGWTVEYDFTLAGMLHADLSLKKDTEQERTLKTIRKRLAAFTDSDPQNTSRKILELFPENKIYQQNFQTESRYTDHRIPPGPWHSWLSQMGFSRLAIDHIMVLAARG